jgi:hypothetical protein
VILDVRSLWDWCRDALGRGQPYAAGPFCAADLHLDHAGSGPEVSGALPGEGMVGPGE